MRAWTLCLAALGWANSLLWSVEATRPTSDGVVPKAGFGLRDSWLSMWESLIKANRYLLDGVDVSDTLADFDNQLASAQVMLHKAKASGKTIAKTEAPSLYSGQNLPSTGHQQDRTKRAAAHWLTGSFVQANPSDVSAVQAWATQIASRAGATFNVTEVNSSASPIEALVVVVQEAKSMAQNKQDSDLQAWLHLLEMHLYQVGSPWNTIRGEFQGLASDRKELLHLSKDADFLHSILNGSASSRLSMAKLFGSYFVGQHVAECGATKEPKQHSALIFTCSFGGGHRSAAQAVKKYLEDDGFQVHVMDTVRDKDFRDISMELAEGFYNGMVLKDRWYRLFNLVDEGRRFFGTLHQECPSPTCNTARKDSFRASILQKHPDVIITVYHMDLLPILEVSKDLGNIPVLHMATDMDIKMSEVFSERPLYGRMRIGVPFDVQASWETVKPVAQEHSFLAGYPVREPFLVPPNASLIASTKARRFPAGAKVMLAMSGGVGQDVPWPALLANAGIDGDPWHIVVVAGANDKIEPLLERTLLGRVYASSLLHADACTEASNRYCKRVFLQGSAQEVTVEVAKSTRTGHDSHRHYITADELAELLDMADVVLTKPGGGTAAEAAYRGTPAIFDATTGLLHWEDFTVRQYMHYNRAVRLDEGDLHSVRAACRKALQLGRSTSLAQDRAHPGEVINTAHYVQTMARRLIAQRSESAVSLET
mmetsp:Transcript_70100/g.131035  ORF Transcript_70100/g.131035 Transcript_70100/m.131035 type:complete len:710 (+) Transcript_70100:109-2238(+)